MPFKIVGADENSDFPARVEARLRAKFEGKIHAGTTVPAAGLGVNGDFYIRTDTSELYGPKAGGTWGSAKSLIGAPGAGATITGATASALAAGATPTVTLGGSAGARTFAFGIPVGQQGVQGPSGTIASASATALGPTATPTVTLGGTPQNRTIEFGIPALNLREDSTDAGFFITG